MPRNIALCPHPAIRMPPNTPPSFPPLESKEIKENRRKSKDINGNQRKSKGNQRASQEIKGKPKEIKRNKWNPNTFAEIKGKSKETKQKNGNQIKPTGEGNKRKSQETAGHYPFPAGGPLFKLSQSRTRE